MHFVQIYPVSTLSQDMRKCGLFALVVVNVSEPLRIGEGGGREGLHWLGRGIECLYYTSSQLFLYPVPMTTYNNHPFCALPIVAHVLKDNNKSLTLWPSTKREVTLLCSP